jgi:hypothetical protein
LTFGDALSIAISKYTFPISFTVKDAENIEDIHPFEAEEPKAITEFELLLTTRNKRKDGIN